MTRQDATELVQGFFRTPSGLEDRAKKSARASIARAPK